MEVHEIYPHDYPIKSQKKHYWWWNMSFDISPYFNIFHHNTWFSPYKFPCYILSVDPHWSLQMAFWNLKNQQVGTIHDVQDVLSGKAWHLDQFDQFDISTIYFGYLRKSPPLGYFIWLVVTGTCFIFHNIWDIYIYMGCHPSNWPCSVETTKQL